MASFGKDLMDLAPGIAAVSGPHVKGLYVGDGKQTIGIIEDDNAGSYLVIWKDPQKQTLPLAVTADGIQLPRVSNNEPYRFISWDDLYNLVQAAKAT